MKKWLSFSIVLLFIMSLFLVPEHTMAVRSHITVEKYTFGPSEQQGSWVQGMVTTDDAIYFYDGMSIKKGKDGVITPYFDFKNLYDDFRPYKLASTSSIYSFLLAHMEFRKGDLYVSGLIFTDDDGGIRHYKDQIVMGQTYSVLFKVKPDKTHELLHIQQSKIHTGIPKVSRYYDNATGTYDNKPMTYADEYNYFDHTIHFDKIARPRFSFTETDDVLLTVQYTNHETYQEYIDIVHTKQGVLATIEVAADRKISPNVLAYLKGNRLRIHDEYGFYERDIRTTEPLIYTKLSEYEEYTKPTYRNGDMYFLNTKGFFKFQEDNGKFGKEWIIFATQVKWGIDISYYDWSDGKKGYLYLNDFSRPRDFWVIGNNHYKK